MEKESEIQLLESLDQLEVCVSETVSLLLYIKCLMLLPVSYAINKLASKQHDEIIPLLFSLQHPFWNHRWSLKSDWFPVVQLINETHYYLL